jgi:hypothetical protein
LKVCGKKLVVEFAVGLEKADVEDIEGGLGVEDTTRDN